MPKCLIVAELGVNWSGDISKAEAMMVEAKQIGCDAVKFQAFRPDQVEGHPRFAEVESSSVDQTNGPDLIEAAKSYGIKFICTPMYIEAVDMLLSLGIRKFKIRYKDWADWSNPGPPGDRHQLERSMEAKALITEAIKKGEEVYISCDVPNFEAEFWMYSTVRWLISTPLYPYPLDRFDASEAFMFNGISDHCPGHIASLSAAAIAFSRGEQNFIVEKHFTLGHSLGDVDDNVSLDPIEFKCMIRDLRLLETMKWGSVP